MDVDSVHKSEEGELHLTISLRAFELIVGKNPVVNPLGSGALVVGLLPFNGAARYGSEEAWVFSHVDVNGFAVRSFITVFDVRARVDSAKR
jgi:hypothetical protein